MFDFLSLKRDPKRVSKAISKTGNTYKAKESLRILIPKRYIDVGFMSIDTTIKTLGIFIIVTDDYKYSLTGIPTTLELSPDKLETVMISNKEYFLLHFDKDSTVIPETQLIKTSEYVFTIIDEFLVKGNRPFFLNYEDLPNVFLEIKKYTGSDIADDISSITLLNSISARHPDNTYYRTDLNKPVKFIGLNDPINRYSDTFSKLSSNYLKTGVLVAVNRPEKEPIIHTEVYTH